ncbi:hypothetical protein NDU88_002548 [Pleurodeles waltl]|uniref:Uncharacterized protein n=1 Tax=Pleurodeles waltl TaxID=8319 RepID=A0AAV7KT32_PLEWA|nr:hypothetical protein NDU88_002548 [Pleurodeles waltl]
MQWWTRKRKARWRPCNSSANVCSGQNPPVRRKLSCELEALSVDGVLVRLRARYNVAPSFLAVVLDTLQRRFVAFGKDKTVDTVANAKGLHIFMGNESSKNTTVRKKQRKRSEQVGPTKHSINSLDTNGLQGLQWEYSKDDLTLYDNVEKQPNPVSLETIYQSIMEHREESKSESRRTQLACRKMQIQIRRVAKTCSEFATRMEEVETRISHLEDEAGSHQVTREAMEKQLEDTQWKLTDLEDRLRRNNLRVLGIPEGLEGSDTHSFMVALFKEAFPDLHQWDWDREIQRAH